MSRPFALLALLALLYLPALGDSSSGTHPDEAYYLGISAEMDAKGAWLTPTVDGEPKWWKPPLLFWAERAAYAAFGRGFFGGRLPVALSAMALALVTGALARRLHGAQAAAPAALLVATTFGFLKFGRLAMMDAPMTLAFAAAAYGAWRACEERRPAQLLWVGLGAGVSFMLKGPVGAVIVLLLAGGYLALRQPRLLASPWTLAAFGLGAALGLPWYVASLAVHGQRFYQFFFVDMNLDRFQHPWTLAGEATLLVGLLVFLLPWTLLVLGGVPALRRWREPPMLLPLLWIGVVLLVFTIPSLKWPHYGLACVPAAALLATRSAPPRWARVGTALILGALALVSGAALVFRLPHLAAAALAGGGVAFLAAAALAWRGEIARSAVATGLGSALVLALVVPMVNPPVIPDAAIGRLAGRELYVDGPGYLQGLFSVAVDRTVHWVAHDELERVLEAGGVVIIGARDLASVPPGLRSRLAPVASWDRIRGYLTAEEVLRSWSARDASLLSERVWAMELRSATARSR
jgi:4-amino-4-deoxy-L-arabinose transferase-like glycosyltransferase